MVVINCSESCKKCDNYLFADYMGAMELVVSKYQVFFTILISPSQFDETPCTVNTNISLEFGFTGPYSSYPEK